MNKIEIVEDKVINNSCFRIIDNTLSIDKNNDLKIDIVNSNINLKIILKDDVKIRIFFLITNSTIDEEYILNDNCYLRIDKFSLNTTNKTIIDLNKEKSKLDYIYSTINTSSNNYNLTVNHNYKDTVVNIYNHGINIGDSLSFIINGNILKTASNVTCNQDSKIITFDDNRSEIIPNFIISNNDVIANHASYIGKFKKNDLFYLKSRGIKESICYKMLIKAFLTGKMNLSYDEMESILKIIDNYWR